MKSPLLCACAVMALAAMHGTGAQTPSVVHFSRTQSNYLLGCGGCHGENGVSNSRLVPDLHDQVGYFLNTAQGRDYLARLPNVAFSDLSDQELADVLNFVVFGIGGSSTPARATAYSGAEVGRLRKRPLNEVSLLEYRSRLIETLIARYGASPRLRVYGGDHYQAPPPMPDPT